jgi:hypothetical protein
MPTYRVYPRLGNVRDGEPQNGRVKVEDEFDALDTEDDDDFLS